MNINFLITIIFSFTQFVFNQTTCKNNLDCSAASACCKLNTCVAQSQCTIDTRNYYIIVGSVGAFFILIVFIYFICVISESRKNILRIKEIVLNRSREMENFYKVKI